jgi:hypothetical protein
VTRLPTSVNVRFSATAFFDGMFLLQAAKGIRDVVSRSTAVHPTAWTPPSTPAADRPVSICVRVGVPHACGSPAQTRR